LKAVDALQATHNKIGTHKYLKDVHVEVPEPCICPENEVEEEVDSVEVSLPAAIQENVWAQVWVLLINI
jgi:hypothetical protein